MQGLRRRLEEVLQLAGLLTLQDPLGELRDDRGDLGAEPLDERCRRPRQGTERGHQLRRDALTDRGEGLPACLRADLQVLDELRRRDTGAEVLEEPVERVRVTTE